MTGARALGRDEVLAAARLAPGSEFWPERLDEARAGLLAAYARRGWNSAQVTATADPPGERGGGQAGDPARVSPPGSPRSASRVSQASPPTGSPAAFGLRVGDILDRTPARPRRRGGAYALSRDAPRPGPGGHAAGHARRDGRGGERPGRRRPSRSPFASRETAATRRRGSEGRWKSIRPRPWTARSWSARPAGWRRSTGTAGFRNVRVEPREVQSPDGTQAVVVFHVSEGRQVLVRTIQFEGRAGLSEEDLRTILERVVRDRTPEAGDQRLEWDPLAARDPAGHRGSPRHAGAAALGGLRRGGLAGRGRGDAARLPRARLGGREGQPGGGDRGRARLARWTSASTSMRECERSSARWASRVYRAGIGPLRRSPRSAPGSPSASPGWRRRAPPPSGRWGRRAISSRR